MSVSYIDELKKKLSELSLIEKEIGKLDAQKKTIRAQIEKWLSLNNVDHYEVEDTNGEIWRMGKTAQNRKSITDWEILREVLGEENSHLIKSSEFEVLRIQQSKSFSDEWLKEQMGQ